MAVRTRRITRALHTHIVSWTAANTTLSVVEPSFLPVLYRCDRFLDGGSCAPDRERGARRGIQSVFAQDLSDKNSISSTVAQSIQQPAQL